MKKTVFLFLLVLVSLSFTNTSAASEGSFEFDGYEIRLNSYLNQNSRGYHIEKLGDSPFTHDALFLGKDIYINTVTEVDHKHIFYGYSHDHNSQTYYDGFLLVLDMDGNIIFEEYLDLSQLEAVHNVVELDQIILIHYAKYYDNGDEIVFEENYIKTYDKNYNFLKETTFPNQVVKIHVTDHLYLFSTNKDDSYEGALTSNLEYIDALASLQIATNTEYQDEVFIHFLNDATLNHEQVENGVYIEYPGVYELEYNDYIYTFKVKPTVTGIEDGKIYTNSVYPVISSGNVYLNDDLFISGTEVNEPGNYVLRIQGANNYEELYHFQITSNLSGVVHNHTYTEPIEITFNGTAYLNNSYIESPYKVYNPGEYILKIQGEDNYIETYYFNMDDSKEETTFLDYVQKYDVVVLAIVGISGVFILKKK